MTWREFIAKVEAQGVTGDDNIGYIDISGYDEPNVGHNSLGEVCID